MALIVRCYSLSEMAEEVTRTFPNALEFHASDVRARYADGTVRGFPDFTSLRLAHGGFPIQLDLQTVKIQDRSNIQFPLQVIRTGRPR